MFVSSLFAKSSVPWAEVWYHTAAKSAAVDGACPDTQQQVELGAGYA